MGQILHGSARNSHNPLKPLENNAFCGANPKMAKCPCKDIETIHNQREKSGVFPVHSPISNRLSQLKTSMKAKAKEGGNVLFIILVCIALFAALAYAVTGSTRSGGGDISREQAQLDAAYVIQQGTTTEAAIQRLRVTNGCDITQISFEGPAIVDWAEPNYVNANAPTDKHCHLYDPSGANLPIELTTQNGRIRNPNGNGTPIWNGTSSIQVCGVGTSNFTGTLAEMSSATDMVLYFKVSKTVCSAINEKLGISSDSNGEPPPGLNGAGGHMGAVGNYAPSLNGMFVYNYQKLGHCDASGAPAGFWFGYSQGCQRIDWPSAPTYWYFHVMIAR